MNDPIVDEVRRIRGEHAARFNHDLWAIFRDIQEQQKRSGLTFVSFADASGAVEPDSRLTDAQRDELRRRVAEDDARPDDVIPWEQVKAEARMRAGQ